MNKTAADRRAYARLSAAALFPQKWGPAAFKNAGCFPIRSPAAQKKRPSGVRNGRRRICGFQIIGCLDQTAPWAIMALETFRKPAMLAPTT